MTIKKKRKRVKRKPRKPRKPRVAIELPPDLPVKVVPDPPKESRLERARKNIWRTLLFVAGLIPLGIWAFQIIVLRQDVHPDWAHVVLMLGGVITSIIMANISDDKISKSTKEIAPLVRGVLRAKIGSTTENKIEIQDK